MNETGGRGSPEIWLDVAYRALVGGGVEAVRILLLTQALKISRASFHCLFKDREELLDALADRWARSNTGALVAAAQVYADTEAEAMLNVIGCFLNPGAFDPQFEFAVRSWALQSPELTDRVNAADEERVASLTNMPECCRHPALDAEVRVRTVHPVQVGDISMQAEETMAERMRRSPTYVEIYTGRKPEPQKLAGFHARHGHVPGAASAA